MPDPIPEPTPAPEPEKVAKTFTQEDVNRIARETKTETKTAAVRELMEKLGIENLDQGAELLAEAARSKEAAKTEVERLTDAARAAEAKAADVTSSAAEKSIRSDIAIELVKAELSVDLLDDATVLVKAKLGNDASVDDIATEVAALKDRMPVLFASKQGTPNSHVTGRSPGSKPVSDYDPKAAAQARIDRLAERPVTHFS